MIITNTFKFYTDKFAPLVHTCYYVLTRFIKTK